MEDNPERKLMETIKKIPGATKRFVVKHKTAFAVAGTAGACLWIMSRASKQFNEFLEEKGLLEEYYEIPED